MRNPQGTPIWYELITPDPDTAGRFYGGVMGWTIDVSAVGENHYRMIVGSQGPIGGCLPLTAEMRAGGAQPGWFFYVGVEDVDATVKKARHLGAAVYIPPQDVPGVGRFAFLADPQGAPFYVMRGFPDEASAVFAEGEVGRCGWNELGAPNPEAAFAFYGALFGWENRETMDMGPNGAYHFIDLGDRRLGAMFKETTGRPRWRFYFNPEELEAAMAAVKAGGGEIVMGPHPVPTGNRIVLAKDPQSAEFALVGP